MASPGHDQRPVGRPQVGSVLALKPLTEAKSRLDLPAPLRRRLALAMFVDTLAAHAAVTDLTVVVSDQPALRTLLRRAGIPDTVAIRPETDTGLNPAFAQGDRWLREQGCDVVVAGVGDLPTLRSDDLTAAITAALGSAEAASSDSGAGTLGTGRGFVADASGVGTSLLVAVATPLDPRFQGRSAEAHAASGARALVPLLDRPRPTLRRDVDTATDLREAAALGLGPATRALVDPDSGDLGRWEPVTVAEPRAHDDRPWTADDPGLAVITAGGHRLPLPATAHPDGSRVLRPGQRLDAVISGDRVLATWW